jgi:hypothetical protein
MQNQEEKTKQLSTIDVQEIIYERRLKEIHRRQGLSKSEIIKEANNPKVYKKLDSRRKKE